MTDYNDGKWNGWNGGDCPVHPKTVVEWVTQNGAGGKRAAWDVSWDRIGPGGTIAFRVVKQYVEPPKPREFWLDNSMTWYVSKEVAMFYNDCPDSLIHVREVMDGEEDAT